MTLPYLTNHVVKVPGTTVTAYLAQWTNEERKGEWTYSLWTPVWEPSYPGEDTCIAVDTIDLREMHGTETPEQVANVAYMLEVEYK